MIDARHLTKPDIENPRRKMPLIRLYHEDGVTWVHGPSCPNPSMRPLYAILTDVVMHGRVHPTHGAGCICMDDYAREIRAHIYRAREEMRRIGMPDEQTYQREFDARTRIQYVLRMAIREI